MTSNPDGTVAYMRTLEVRRPDGTVLTRHQVASSEFLRVRDLFLTGVTGDLPSDEVIRGAAEVWLREGPDADWEHIATQAEDGALTWTLPATGP